jgi:hypothetical protein
MTDVRTFIIEVSKIEISRRSIQSSEFANNERNLNEYSL